MIKNTVPPTVHRGKKDAASAAALPRSEAGADGQTRTDDRRFTNTTPTPDNQRHPTISGVLTPSRTDVQVHHGTTADVRTVPHTVPTGLQLKQRTDWSFAIVSGTPADLAAWLEQRGYLKLRLRNSAIEAYRLAGELRRGERCFITIFRSGTVVCQGSAGPRRDTLLLLGRLVPCTPHQPILIEQISMFEEVPS